MRPQRGIWQESTEWGRRVVYQIGRLMPRRAGWLHAILAGVASATILLGSSAPATAANTRVRVYLKSIQCSDTQDNWGGDDVYMYFQLARIQGYPSTGYPIVSWHRDYLGVFEYTPAYGNWLLLDSYLPGGTYIDLSFTAWEKDDGLDDDDPLGKSYVRVSPEGPLTEPIFREHRFDLFGFSYRYGFTLEIRRDPPPVPAGPAVTPKPPSVVVSPPTVSN